MKLHIGCGTVYLKDYINIHPCPDYLSKDPLAEYIIADNLTDVNNYYKHSFGSKNKTVADEKSTLLDLQYQDVEEICMFHVLEHIPKYDLHETMCKISSMLKVGGYFRVAVPDTDAIVLEYSDKLKSGILEEDKEWYYRYIYGTQKDKYSHHFCGYNKSRLISLLEKYNLRYYSDLDNQNFYPAVHLLAQKV